MLTKTIQKPTLSEAHKRELLKDFYDWSGGYQPHEHHDLEVYLELAMPVHIDEDLARDFFEEWCDSH